jgi:hypothetical protein
MADPEKAIADRVLLEKGRFSVRTMKQFLFESMRIDPGEFHKLDTSLFSEAARISGRHSLEILAKVRAYP